MTRVATFKQLDSDLHKYAGLFALVGFFGAGTHEFINCLTINNCTSSLLVSLDMAIVFCVVDACHIP